MGISTWPPVGFGGSQSKVKKFGVRWHKTLSSTRLERLYDSVGKTFAPSVGTSAGYSGFDDEPIFSGVRLCWLNSGIVTAYEGEAGFSRTPASGDIMVEIPRFYYKIEDTSLYRDFIISDQPLSGFNISPRHAPYDGNANGHEKIYRSAYTASAGYRSVSGAAPHTSVAMDSMRSGCKAKGSGYYAEDFATLWTRNLLYLVEVADWDCQSAIGQGIIKGSRVNTGGGDSISGHSGRADGADGQTAVKYRHMENIWGNVWINYDGANAQGRKAYICLDPKKYQNGTTEGYTALSYDTAATGGSAAYQKSLGYDPVFPWAQICTETGGADGAYISDTFTSGNGWGFFRGGADFNSAGTQGGIFSLQTNATGEGSGTNCGFALIYLP